MRTKGSKVKPANSNAKSGMLFNSVYDCSASGKLLIFCLSVLHFKAVCFLEAIRQLNRVVYFH